MVTKESAEERFKKLKEDQSNNVCFDCWKPNPEWASVSYGIFICENCAIKHIELGLHLSFVRKIVNDHWSIKQLKMMTVGGNSALARFFSIYHMPADMEISVKYRTRAAQYYREMLKKISDGRIYQAEQPSLEQGLLMVNEEEAKSFCVENNERGFSWKGTFDSAISAARSLGDKVTNKVKEMTEKPTVKEWEVKTVSALSKLESGVKEGITKTKEWSNTPMIQNFKENTKSMLDNIKNNVKRKFEGVSTRRESENIFQCPPDDANPPTPPDYEKL
ncbi:unnamed protein product [Blepharisma stoltei]|uniref:Arf-GAP domain-containing protein n=1 Tax=Blepharisma stoltei TaxID=1481888 RepID=A0AAU9K699_9CILI|nr:unnamed protein product [Blepharisma stoltei]